MVRVEDLSFKKFLYLVLSLILVVIVLNWLYPLDIDKLDKPRSTIIYDKDNNILRIHLSNDGFVRLVIENNKITQDIKNIVTSYEDRYFYSHYGVNPFSIIRAIWFNLNNQRVIGASTISMQVARMMYHKPRTLKSKISEIFRAFQLEWKFTKDEILAFYLNNTPYGGNIEGFASASYLYFGVDYSLLSIAQISYLTSIPKNPNKNSPQNIDRIDYLKQRVLNSVKEREIIDINIIDRALKENITPKRAKLPQLLPHLTGKIKTGNKVYTTIDIKLQQKIEKYIKDSVKEFQKYNIFNGSAVVIENKTMNILAYVGSQDFYDKYHEGENDGVVSIISAGSTLKPFVYALALEEGIITPLRNIYDISLYIAGYRPQNYSKKFIGDMTTSSALQYSINTVAVELDRLLQNRSLYELLEKAKIKSIDKKKNFYGSSLTLGGCGITLLDLAQLYSALANGGYYQKASYLKNLKNSKIKILTKESSYLIANILSNSPRDNFSSSWEYIKGANRVAFKTGTSAKAKDLLSIGFTPKYTVAVWYGNFNAMSSKPAYNNKDDKPTGIKIASPTLLKIFKILDDSEWFQKPKNIITQKICQDIIEIGECKNYIEDEVIKDINLSTPCRVLRAEVLSKMMQNGTIKSMNNLSNHRCYKKWKSYKPLITSPIDNSKYIHNKFLPNEYKKIKFECYSFESNSTIYWFIDNNKIIKSHSAKPIYLYLKEGRHNISCLDQASKIKSIIIDSIEE